MHQKDAARQAWIDAGLFESNDPKLKTFLKQLDESPMSCWPDLVEKCRDDFAEYKERLANALWKSGDKVLRINLIRFADLRREDELKIVSHFAGAADPAHDQPELRAVVGLGHERLLKEVAKKPHLPADIHRSAVSRLELAERAAEIARELEEQPGKIPRPPRHTP